MLNHKELLPWTPQTEPVRYAVLLVLPLGCTMEQSLATLAAPFSEEYQRGREHQGVSFSHPVQCTVKKRKHVVGADFRNVSGKFGIIIWYISFLYLCD